MLISIIITVLLFAGIFKLTGFFFRIVGKIFGAVLGLIGYTILGFLAIGAFGLAVLALPVILAAGAITIVLMII